MKKVLFYILMFFTATGYSQVLSGDKVRAKLELTLAGVTVTEIKSTMPATPVATQLLTAPAIKTYVDAQTGIAVATIVVITPTNNFVFGVTPRPIKEVFRNGILQHNVIVIQSTGTVNFTINLTSNEQISIIY